MTGIRAKLSEKVTFTTSRGRYCLMSSLFTFATTLAIIGAQRLIRDGRGFDVFSDSIDSFACALVSLIVFYVIGGEMVRAKQNSKTS